MSENTSTEKNKYHFLERYRTIIIAIACFLIFDLGVLVINFYTSFQMKDDAIGINLSGRQRMLSQRMTKALLTISIVQDPTILEASRKELQNAVELFNMTLYGFRFGANVTGADGSTVFLKASEGQASPTILADTAQLWETYYALLQPVINNTASTEEKNLALEFALANNLTLLNYMNDLTNDLEHVADKRASRLRMVQSTGIILALLNFIFILYKFIGQLRRADTAVAKVINENEEILATVQEGLFLLMPDQNIGTQISKSTHTLFSQDIKSGDNFIDLLSSKVSSKVLDDTSEYIKLLFSPHIKEQLIKSINPLSEVQVTITNKLNNQVKRYLSFNFNRVLSDTQTITHLLVTVQDVTKTAELKHTLENERKASQKEFKTLLKAIESDPQELQTFISSSEAKLLHINDILKNAANIKTDRKLQEIIHEITREVHTIKGNALTLGLDTFAEQAHDLETELKNTTQFSGDSLLALPITLNHLLLSVTMLKGLTNFTAPKIPSQETHVPNTQVLAPEPQSQPDTKPAKINPLDPKALESLTQKIANDTHKLISLNVKCHDDWTTIPQKTTQIIRDIVIQLIRNSVVHGIETPENRIADHKDQTGNINVTLEKKDQHSNSWTLTVTDDGTGLSALRIREKLRSLGWFTEEQLKAMNDKEIIAQIFKPSFSTANTVSMHAGRGAGLDLVKSKLKQLNMGHLKISSKTGAYTKTTVTFSS